MTPLQIELWNDAIWWFESEMYSSFSFSIDGIRNEYGWELTPDYDVETWFNLLIIEVLNDCPL